MTRIHWMRVPVFLAALLLAWRVLAQDFADEGRDWGVPAIPNLRGAPYTAPTPNSIPGASLMDTRSLKDILGDAGSNRHILIDVASGERHMTLPGAIWIPGAGRGTSFVDPVQSGFVDLMDKLTAGDKARPIVFFCVSAQCWLSYNAALRAIAAGYSRVFWYRGGIEAWRAAGLPLVAIDPPPGR
jgi:PQQ-dependent catabolism-associated CXXCW motif protein